MRFLFWSLIIWIRDKNNVLDVTHTLYPTTNREKKRKKEFIFFKRFNQALCGVVRSKIDNASCFWDVFEIKSKFWKLSCIKLCTCYTKEANVHVRLAFSCLIWCIEKTEYLRRVFELQLIIKCTLILLYLT